MMQSKEKLAVQRKANHSQADSEGINAIQRKAVSVIQKAAPEEEVQQHKSEATVQKAEAPDMEEKPSGVAQKKSTQENPEKETFAQRKENKTGMPDSLKSGIESLSGMNLDDVRVHYNSAKPAQLNAHAFAQGREIHVASGQEKHLPHEAWHIVQQAQGRVKPTTQMKAGVAVNDDPSLEHEADMMGAKAAGIAQKKSISAKNETSPHQLVLQLARPVSNRMRDNMQASLARVFGGPANRYQINQDSGKVFPDGPPRFTTGHHGVAVTDTKTGKSYSCDFHNDGRYYTRG